jgi:hypothetical protein
VPICHGLATTQQRYQCDQSDSFYQSEISHDPVEVSRWGAMLKATLTKPIAV